VCTREEREFADKRNVLECVRVAHATLQRELHAETKQQNCDRFMIDCKEGPYMKKWSEQMALRRPQGVAPLLPGTGPVMRLTWC
jgi:type II secretory pathway predicted ATPase ExeA